MDALGFGDDVAGSEVVGFGVADVDAEADGDAETVAGSGLHTTVGLGR